MTRGFLLGLVVVFATILHLGIQVLLYRRAVRFIRKAGESERTRVWLVRAIRAWFIYLNLPLPFLILAGRTTSAYSAIPLYLAVYPFMIWMVSSLVLFIALLIKYSLKLLLLIWLLVRRLLGAAPIPSSTFRQDRREFLRASSLATYVIVVSPVAAMTYGAAVGRLSFSTTRLDLYLPRLPSALAGLRLTQISDVHSSPYLTQRDIEDVVARINAGNPDLVIMTGDFVSISLRFLDPCLKALASLRPRHGIFACLGNHDYYVGSDEVRAGLEKIGVSVLVNASETLQIGLGKLNVAGVDDLWEGQPDFEQALRDTDSTAPTLLMSHNPNVFPLSANLQVDLTLAGHTHGGQVAVNLLGGTYSLVHLAYHYVSGLYRRGHAQLYVNRGIGTIGPPVRINAPPEITELRLLESTARA